MELDDAPPDSMDMDDAPSDSMEVDDEEVEENAPIFYALGYLVPEAAPFWVQILLAMVCREFRNAAELAVMRTPIVMDNAIAYAMWSYATGGTIPYAETHWGHPNFAYLTYAIQLRNRERLANTPSVTIPLAKTPLPGASRPLLNPARMARFAHNINPTDAADRDTDTIMRAIACTEWDLASVAGVIRHVIPLDAKLALELTPHIGRLTQQFPLDVYMNVVVTINGMSERSKLFIEAILPSIAPGHPFTEDCDPGIITYVTTLLQPTHNIPVDLKAALATHVLTPLMYLEPRQR